MMMYFCGWLWHALHPFTKYTDQQCHILNSVGALLILIHAAIQVFTCLHLLWNVCG